MANQQEKKGILTILLNQLLSPRNSFEASATAHVSTTSSTKTRKIPVDQFDQKIIQDIQSRVKASGTPSEVIQVFESIKEGKIPPSRAKILRAIFKFVQANPELATGSNDLVKKATQKQWAGLEKQFNMLNQLAPNDAISQSEMNAIKHSILENGANTLTRVIQDAAIGKEWKESDVLACMKNENCKLLQAVQEQTSSIETKNASPTEIETEATEQSFITEEPEKEIAKKPANYLYSFLNGALYGATHSIKRNSINWASRLLGFSGITKHASQIIASSLLNYALTEDISASIAFAVIEETLNKLGNKPQIALQVSSILYSCYTSGFGLNNLASMLASYAGNVTGHFAANKVMSSIGIPQQHIAEPTVSSIYRRR